MEDETPFDASHTYCIAYKLSIYDRNQVKCLVGILCAFLKNEETCCVTNVLPLYVHLLNAFHRGMRSFSLLCIYLFVYLFIHLKFV